MSRDPEHRVIDGRWPIVQFLTWLAHQVAAGRVEAATVTLAEPDRLHCAVRLKGFDDPPAD
jgi:hypothetical protein